MNNKFVVFILIAIGIVSRLIPHTPNFTPLGAIALFSGYYLPKQYSLVIMMVILFISDAFLGFHPTMPWVYGSFILISILGSTFKGRFNNRNFVLFPLISSLLFFLITNFGVWITGSMYTHDLSGLLECYLMALPFFRMTIIADMFYSVVLFGGFKLFKAVDKFNFKRLFSAGYYS